MATNPCLDWSELVSDVLSLIYKRLSIADFARARTVCSSWYSVSRSSSPRENHVPWLIFNLDRDWKLFDPEEGKFYKTRISRLGLADCRSLASCGNWVLVRDEAFLYIINPFTLEIINDLPSLNSHGKYLEYCPINLNYGSSWSVRVENAVLWVDERTKDYLVAWTVRSYHDRIRFCMKGDEEWSIFNTCGEFLGGDECVDHMVYKDKKLYILTDYGRIKILDFSQDFLRFVPNHPYINGHFRFNVWRDTKMRVTTSGDVLLIHGVQQYYGGKASQFLVYKMNSTNEEWELVDSSEEALVWDFCDCDFESPFLKESSYYENLTQTIERFEELRGVSNGRWLLPCFGFEE